MSVGKTDAVLGRKVNEHLIKLGLHTPVNLSRLNLDESYKLQEIEHYMTKVLETLGLDLNDDSLKETPKRMSKMFVKELYWGLDTDLFPKITTIENKMKYDEMLIEKNIAVMSACEHHGVTIDGVAHVAYIPKNKVIGLSKLNRVVNYFSRRPQVQERLTSQIFETFKYILETEDVAIVIDAVHYCVKSRGIQDQNSHTITSALGGVFKEGPVRAEFITLVR